MGLAGVSEAKEPSPYFSITSFSFYSDCRNKYADQVSTKCNDEAHTGKEEELGLALKSCYNLGLNKAEQADEKSNDYAEPNIYLLPLHLRITKCSL